MDDFSRFILAWRLQRDVTSDSFIEVVQDAVDLTGMTEVPMDDRTKLLSDNGPGYVSRSFREYLHLVGIRHILASPYHPQTNGKLERYHQSIKRDVNQIPYDAPANLDAAIADFMSYNNNLRYHKALSNVTPSDVLNDRAELRSLHGRILTGIMLVQDLAFIPMMAILPALGGGGEDIAMEISLEMLKAVVVLGATALLGIKAFPWLLNRVAKLGSREIFILMLVAITFVTASVTHAVGLSAAMGAFLAGLVLDESEFGHRALSEIIPI